MASVYFKDWTSLLGALCRARVRNGPEPDTKEREALVSFQKLNAATIDRLFERKPYIHTLAQFSCVLDAVRSISYAVVPVAPAQIDERDEKKGYNASHSDVSPALSERSCVFTGATEGDLFAISFETHIPNVNTLFSLQPLVCISPFYCVTKRFLLFLQALHFLGRIEALLIAEPDVQKQSEIIVKFEHAVRFLRRFHLIVVDQQDRAIDPMRLEVRDQTTRSEEGLRIIRADSTQRRPQAVRQA
jgi:hypothetical protein